MQTEPAASEPARRRHHENADLKDALASLEIHIEASAGWRAVFALLRGGWPGVLTDSEALAYLVLLDDLNPTEVIEGLKILNKTGSQFRPKPSEARAACQRAHTHRLELGAWKDAMLAFARRHGAGKAIDYFDPSKQRQGDWPPPILSAYSANVQRQLQTPHESEA